MEATPVAQSPAEARFVTRRPRRTLNRISLTVIGVCVVIIAAFTISSALGSSKPQTPVQRCVTALGNTGTGFADGSLWSSVQVHGGGGQFWSEMNKVPACVSLSLPQRLEVLPLFMKDGNANG